MYAELSLVVSAWICTGAFGRPIDFLIQVVLEIYGRPIVTFDADSQNLI